MKARLLNLLTLALLILVGCQNNYMSESDAQQWIAAYTSDLVDPDSKIRIEPTDSLKKLIDPQTPLDDIFDFSPRIKGEAVFAENGRFIDFNPYKGQLEEGQKYECRIDIAALTGIETLDDFAFTFHVAKREVKMQDVHLRIDPQNIGMAIVTGKMVFSHPVEESSVDAKAFSCSKHGAEVKINCTDDALVWDFIVTDVPRDEEDYDLAMKYSLAGTSAKTSHSISVPGLSGFILHSATNNPGSEPFINLEFTNQLDPQQDLDGLITIDRCDVSRIERNGASVRVYYNCGGAAKINVNVSEMVRSSDGRNLSSDVNQEFELEAIPPAIVIPISGTILPDGNNLVFPFRAVNLAAVDVEVVKIYSDNVLHFLQDNEIDNDYYLRKSGRLIYKKTVRLDENKSLDLHQWQNFSINLNGLFKQERSAIYNIRLSFRQAYSLYDRDEVPEFEMMTGITDQDNKVWDKQNSYISREAPDYNWEEYYWRDTDDPSKASYYMASHRMPEYNLLASNLGLIVKRADDQKIWTTVSDIMTTTPLEGVKVTAYNYQLREVGSGWTDSRGFADFPVSGKPFVVTASDGVSTSYLKVKDGYEKSTSVFDVSGKSNTTGVKGYIYGERGIWRPGDDIHLTMIVEDKQKTLPSNHPVAMELYTPDGILYDRQTLTKGVNGFYAFCIKTTDDVETGRWSAKFTVGGTVFNHTVQIESIKPNRLKVNLTLPEVLTCNEEAKAQVNAKWLTGVIAKGLQTNLEVTLYNNDKPFSDHNAYRFSNPLLDFTPSTYELTSGILDSLGNVALDIVMPQPENAPGMLQANFLCRVEEAGGNESITSKSVKYSPFKSYVGIDLKQEYETDTDLRFPVITVDQQGRLISGKKLEWKIYELEWNWWWQGTADNFRRYVESNSAEVVASGDVVTKDGKAEIPFKVDYPKWGRFLVFVKDMESGHATGGIIMVDWPQWRGRSDKDGSKGASILSFSLDKNKYEVGETAQVFLPKVANGRVLLSVENGNRVISRQWVKTSADKEAAFGLKVTKDMAPNFYVHATLLQPHSQTLNDLPVRMYGIQGAEVIDNNSILHPLIEVADEILPQKEFTVKVKEQNGRPMTYTLAIVDEGLLDINGFKTPNAWRTMNMREALGVKTWDLYDNVIGAYAGKFTSVLSIGGDEALRAAAGKEKRFNPVVKFMGPFTTDGRSKTHKITLPMYVGSVRVMVVAAQNGAYGSAEKNVTVRSPLMVISTLPRVLSSGDKVNMPVNLFVTKDDIKEVDLSVSVEGPVKLAGAASQKVKFTSEGEQIIDFALECDPVATGMAKITVKACSGTHTASETINIMVKNPHEMIVDTQQKLLGAGEAKFVWNADNTGSVTLEMSTLPSINLDKLYSFVKNYSHYCTEQLSSRAMFLLYGRKFLSAEKQAAAEQMIRKILKEIASRQLSDGGFRYWKNSASAHEWATSMAGEAMTEALNQGFAVASGTYQKWIDYQIAQSKSYSHSTKNAGDLIQAYRLYTLALAGKEQTAYMNRLKEAKKISEQAKYRLAAAYYIAGRTSVAEDVLAKESVITDGDYSTFWSELRDDAMKLETLVLMGMISDAMPLAQSIASDFSAQYCSTQEVAFVAPAFSRLADVVDDIASSVTVSYEGSSKEFKNVKGVKTLEIPAAAGAVTIRNASEQSIYLSLTSQRQPSAQETIQAKADGAEISLIYTDINGKPIDVKTLKQGDEIYADIKVRLDAGASSESMALTFKVPSGWEIWNERINNLQQTNERTDIRDDRVNWYFSLRSNEEKTFRVKLRAAYEGEYIMPSTIVEDMYRADCRAYTASCKVKISK